jgi:arylsulfatase A-like enzyme/cytochrome c-type biogenesis protein CcmH/NrfG
MAVLRWLLCFATLGATALGGNRPDKPKPDTPATPESPSSYPSTVVITLDTTRADRMGFLGSKRGLTPNLDALARQSIVFTHAYSQAPLTPTSHATIFTGTYPQYHQVLTFPIPLAKSLPYLPDILHAHGYHTAAFVGSLALDPTWGAPGFERGFDTFDAGYTWAKFTPETRYQSTERRAAEVVAHALAWLKQRPPGPFFLWVHLFDPHDPYDPPEPYKTRYAKALYDGEIAYTDSAVGTLLQQLKKLGLYDGAVIAVMADHGESLGAHGEEHHGIFLYDETIHVPLTIKLPGNRAAEKRVENPVELADVMPTLLENAGIEVPKDVQGASLLALTRTGPEGEAAAQAWQRNAYSQADYGHLAFAWSALQSLRTGKYLYIQAPRRELYDEGVDAKAVHNLASSVPAVADTLSFQVKDFQQQTTNMQEMPKAALDAAKIHKLSALGYVATGSNPALAASPENGADPKDKIATANAILQINMLLENRRCTQAKPVMQKAIADDSNISILHFYLGGCYMEEADYEKAAPQLRKAVELDPTFTAAEMNLGRASMNLHDYSGAVTAFEHVAITEPHILDPHVYLVVAYAMINSVPEEIRECRRVLQTLPDHFGSNLNLGRFLALSGDLQGAIPSLRKAATIRPNAPDPHIYLADVYAKLGREADAQRERAEAERLGAVPIGPIPPEDKPEPE